MAHNVMNDRRYARTDEWLQIDGSYALVGISDHAQDSLSDIVYVELPGVGDKFDAGQAFGVVESVKAAADVYAPIAGTVTAVNETLADAPQTVNEQPFGAGWLFRLKPDNAADRDALMSAADYEKAIEG